VVATGDLLAASTVVVLGDVLTDVAGVLAAGSSVRSPGIVGGVRVVGLKAAVVERRCDEC